MLPPPLSWSKFVSRHAAGHLVIATLPTDSDEIGTSLARQLKGEIRRLVEHLGLVGAYALTIVRVEGTAEILAAFENRAGADAFASAVQARDTGRYSEWKSRRCFVLDGPASDAIAIRLMKRQDSTDDLRLYSHPARA